MTGLTIDPSHILIDHLLYRSANLIVILTRIEEGLPAIYAVLVGYHVLKLPLLVKLGPRVEWHHIWVVVLATASCRVSELVEFLLDTDLLTRSVHLLFLLIKMHGLNNKIDSSFD